MSKENLFQNLSSSQEELLITLRKACKKIAPVWPLENFVAVNPYLGHTDKKFDNVAHDLAAAGGIQMTLPVDFYLQKFKEGIIKPEILELAINKRNLNVHVNDFIASLESNLDEIENTKSIASVADIATEVTGKDWNRFVTTRVSTWAASYFDNGQAIWTAADQNLGVFASWKLEAKIDRTTELTGLKGFRKLVKELPDNPIEAIDFALKKLIIPEAGRSLYLHRVLLGLGGWAAYAARLDWDSELNGGKDGKLIEFLSVLVCWEACLLASLNNEELNTKWKEAKEILSISNVERELNLQLTHKLILQEAFDLSSQENILNKFQIQKTVETRTEQKKAQAIFCIDVRSEVYRRNLELVDDQIETLGFAGFFAFPVKYLPIGSDEGEAQCPVLLTTSHTVMEEIPDTASNLNAFNSRIFHRQVQQVWKSFKSGAITCFSFVSPMGLTYLPKLFTDSFGITRPVPHPSENGLSAEESKNINISLQPGSIEGEIVGIELSEQIQMAKNALTAMSLTDDFAKFILIVGHGSTMVNNPHSTGYDCGACGGHTGEANARVAAAVLNNREVRAGLQKEDIFIPTNTTFLACLHDTTTDEVTVFNEKDLAPEITEELESVKKSLSLAGVETRKERSSRIISNKDATDFNKSIIARSKDWSETRPEWGLAGCSAFVVAPRGRTKGVDFEGQSFLHSYQWQKDEGFAVLELIMTAPMLVTSWINLQYYGSTVDNKNLGSGNKTLHNVTAGVGVLEGFSGDLRVGLPMQSIHDGDKFQHEPLRLNVIIEAPMEAMNNILKKHPAVKALCDNGWLYLLAMDKNGQVSHRYQGDLSWEKIAKLAA